METAAVKCPPINTARLKPIRQRIHRHIMAITESGHVSMETRSHVITLSSNQLEITKELVRVSPDGKQIEVYRGPEGILSVGDCPTSCQPDQVYMYPNLPDKLWKKYQHAHKFVELIRSRTPRVILVTEKAQCKLMENFPQPDFLVYFHDGVTLMLSKCKVTLTDQDGSTLTFNEDMVASHVSPTTLTLLEYSQQCRDQCVMIEKSVSDLQSASSCQDLFPIIVGTNSQQCLLSTNQPSLLPLLQGQANTDVADRWQDTFNGGNIKLPLNICYNESKPHQLPDMEAKPHQLLECSEEPVENITQTMNVPHSKICECKSPCGCTCGNNSDSCVEEITNLQETPNCRMSPQVQGLHRTISLQGKGHDLEVEHTTLSEDFSGPRNNVLYLKSLLASTSSRIGHTKNGFLSSNFCENNNHLLSCSGDEILQNVMAQNLHSEKAHQLPVQQSISVQTLNSDLIYKFYSDCNIPQNSTATCPFPEYNCDRCLKIQDKVTSLAFSPRYQTPPCDEICNEQSQEIRDTNMPDFITFQVQNNFVTPQKSSAFVHSNSAHFLKQRMWKDTSRPNVPHEAMADKKCLQNVRRNLFSDLSSNDISSPLPVFQQNILNKDFLDISSTSSSENLPSLNLSQTKLTLENQDTELQPHEWSTSGSASYQTFVPAESPTREVPFQLPNIIPSQPTSTVPLKLSPAKAQNIMKTVLRYSTPKQGQTKTLAFPVQLDTSSINNCTQIGNLSHANNDHFLDSSMSSISTAESNFPNSLMPVSKQEIQISDQDFSASPKKSAPVRKIASLSPLKMSSKEFGESSGQKNLVYGHANRMQNDLVNYDQSISPVKSNTTKPSNGTSSNKNIQSYYPTQTYQSPIKPNSDPSTLRRTSIYAPLFKELPAFSHEAGKLGGLDLPLPLATQIRNSLDVSSDGCSSPPSSASDVICQVFVPYTGWASFYATGTVWILYNDGTQLGVQSSEASMIYVDQDGSRRRYTNSDVVPEIVKLKLEKLPKVIDLLMKSQAASSVGDLL